MSYRVLKYHETSPLSIVGTLITCTYHLLLIKQEIPLLIRVKAEVRFAKHDLIAKKNAKDLDLG